jgi:hypothetical protein
MSTITDILNAPSTGLLPYLDTTLEGDWGRFLIHPYNFGTQSLQSGFRLRDVRTKMNGEIPHVTQGIIAGRMIVVTDAVQSQIDAALLAQAIDRTISHWSRCKCPGLISPVTDFSGTLAIAQDRNISSQNPNGWWAIVIRSFEIQYWG